MAKIGDIILLGAIGLAGYLVYKVAKGGTLGGITRTFEAIGNTARVAPSAFGEGFSRGFSVFGWKPFYTPTAKSPIPVSDRPPPPNPMGLKIPPRANIPPKYSFQGKTAAEKLTVISRAAVESERYPFRSHYQAPRIVTTSQGTSIIRRSGR